MCNEEINYRGGVEYRSGVEYRCVVEYRGGVERGKSMGILPHT